jgi:hypothetical protein
VDPVIDEGYLEWLYSQVGAASNRNPARSHWSLTKQLHSKPFRTVVSRDDNRAVDGVVLRQEFLLESQFAADPVWLAMDASMLEVLVALSRRAAFVSDGVSLEWFWKMLQNVEMHRYTDDIYDEAIYEAVDRSLEIILDRRYRPNGVGGFFPLHHAHHDQRTIELWYQLNSYILENTDIATAP